MEKKEVCIQFYCCDTDQAEIQVSLPGHQSIESIVNSFRAFLLAVGYAEQTVNEFIPEH